MNQEIVHDTVREKILTRVREVLRRKHMAISTEDAYTGWIARFFDFCRDFGFPREMCPEERMERFLTHLAVNLDVAASTQNGAFHALRFLYVECMWKELDVKRVNALRATRPQQIRKAPSVEDTIALLQDVRDVSGYRTALATRMIYGSGLRVSEPLNLRIKEVRISRRELYIIGAKPGKDRVVRLPEVLIEQIEQQMVEAKIMWERDQQARIPIALEHGLARKYPEYQWAWQWAWLFPLHTPSKHPRTGEIVRYHMLPSAVQQAVKESRRRLGIHVIPHELRHAYATHCLDRGVNMKALQEALGHAHIDTTAGYCHAEAKSVISPLDIAMPGNVVRFEAPGPVRRIA